MNRMESLYKTSKEILDILNKEQFTSDERTVVITLINNLLEQRATILEQLKPPYSEAEEAIGVQIVEMDKVIRKKMDRIYQEIQNDLKQLKQQKNSNRTYINPYKDMKIVDGMYLDNKL